MLNKYSQKEQQYYKDCDKADYDISDISEEYALQIQPKIIKSEQQEFSGLYTYKHNWCKNARCEYKDKCERTKENLKLLGPISDPEITNNSTKYFDEYFSKISKTDDIRTLKLVEDESKKCGFFRNLFEKFCKTTNPKVYSPPITLLDGQSFYGDESHAFQIKNFERLASEARTRINQIKPSTQKSPKRKTPLRKTTRRNQRSRKTSSIHKIVARKEQVRINRKK